MIDPSVFPQFQKAKETEKKADAVVKDKKQDEYDPYQALRGIVYENPVVPVQQVEQEESKELKPLEFPQDDDDEDEWQGMKMHSHQRDMDTYSLIYIEFCSSSSVDDNSLDENEISLDAVVESTLKMQDEQEEKPPVIDIFNDLNPFSSIKRF